MLGYISLVFTSFVSSPHHMGHSMDPGMGMGIGIGMHMGIVSARRLREMVERVFRRQVCARRLREQPARSTCASSFS